MKETLFAIFNCLINFTQKFIDSIGTFNKKILFLTYEN